jgi:hypothetical protein
MNKKAILVFAACLALLAPAGIVSAGDGSATVANTAPTIVSYDIRDGTNAVITGVAPQTSCFLTIVVNDVDGYDDVVNTTMLFNYPNTPVTNDPVNTYKVAYNETNGAGYLIWPTTDDGYLIGASRVYTGLTQVTYVFEMQFNKTARDTGASLAWGLSATTKDASGSMASTGVKYHSMGAFVEITYAGNAGGTAFSWAGLVGSNISASFTTTVTSNDVYTLDASYSGFFYNATQAVGWGNPVVNPTLWVKQTSQTTAKLLPNCTAGTGLNITWYTNLGIRYQETVGHVLSLNFPAGLDKGPTYTGVKIWIQARNS